MTDDGKRLDHEQHDSSEPDVAGEDEAVPGLDGDPLARANRS
jgi:hypothetical protein